ncbi:caspase domain-containing protein [Phyllosticta capitalensis]|uniref:Caspase domain-containing protein n=1 Tax=Phyllosticta capitalensis TaxID=121624 RepID=A0ABR1Z1M7_9PEZI
MSPKKRALLIASPFQGLPGPLNDVRTMKDVLCEQGFEISTCSGESATREGILEAWRRLINDVSSRDDAVVIYYSGHGGIVEDLNGQPDNAEDASRKQQPWRYQFLVPVDFRVNNQWGGSGEEDADPDACFTGILDVELENLLRATSDRTRNVTTIFDCCHSGRMARYPSQSDAVPRNLPKVQYATISNHIARLRAAEQWPTGTRLNVEGNKYAVRIAAAASTETAWEHGKSGQWAGVFTEALAKVLRDAGKNGNRSSWRTTLLRVREEVNIDFPLQNPNVEGLDTRLLFSLKEVERNALVLKPDEEEGILQAGRVSGVREGNVYALMPLGAEQPSDEEQIGTATVTDVVGLKAITELSLFAGKGPIPSLGVAAFLVREALYKWPVAHPEGLDSLVDAVDGSKYLRRQDGSQDSTPLMEFRKDGQNLALVNNQGVLLASRSISETDSCPESNASKDLVERAEQLARAQHLLTLTCEDPEEKLEHRIDVMLGTVRARKPERLIDQDGSGLVAHGERVYISLQNNGTNRVYVSVFNINVAGKVSLISRGRSTGIDLPPNKCDVIGADPSFPTRLRGVPITWPDSIPMTEPVNEHIVLIMTDSPVDLKYLESKPAADFRGDIGPSSLERLTFCLATGTRRDMASENRGGRICYDTLHIPFLLTPFAVRGEYASWNQGVSHALRAEDIPLPEEVVDQGQDLPLQSPSLVSESRGTIGAIIRTAKGIPPYVWVVNEHDEDILVVVSKYRPNRMLSGGGVNASTTGAGIDLNSTKADKTISPTQTFESPVCKKLLAARAQGKADSIGTFPLWTRKEGFGVISIYKGDQQELCVENDQISLGATAFFSNQPDLRIVDYRGNEIS